MVPRPGPLGWLVFAWGVGGVVLVLAEAILRLAPIAAGLGDAALGPIQTIAAAGWSAFMLYAEAWRGFHQKFAPRVVVRALALATGARPWQVLLAPVITMGLLHATRRRLVATWLLVLGIVAIVWIVGWLPPPWRAIVDLGVVLGLGGGTLSLLFHAGRAIAGRPPSIAADLPSQV
jgi:hypothetical protein